MDPNEIVTAIVSAAIAAIVPSVLKQFWPEVEPTEAVPLFSWSVAGLVGGALGIVIGAPLLKDSPVPAWIVGWGVVGLVGAVILLAPSTKLKARHGETRQPA